MKSILKGRISYLDRYSKILLLILAFMVLLFAVLYIVTLTRVGLLYRDVILVPSEEDGNTVYSGRIHWKKAVFTVTEDKTVWFQYGDESYGPYLAKGDQTALPESHSAGMVGVELRRGDEIVFRGGVSVINGMWFLTNEDGSSANVVITIDMDREERDFDEPSPLAILSLMAGPELTHKGDPGGWVKGTLLCLLVSFLILFADDLFYMRISRRVVVTEDLEPNEWEIRRRNILGTLLTAGALTLYIIGLL